MLELLYHRLSMWADMRRAAALEELLNARRRHLGRDPVNRARFAAPLSAAIPDGQPLLPGLDLASPTDDAGDNGACWT
jgi:hypothetical protein